MKKIGDFLYKSAEIISIVCVIGMVFLEAIVVVGRYCFNYTPPWGEEMALFLMTWLGMVSASMAERTKSHIRISAIDAAFPPALLRVFGIIRYLAKIAFFGCMAYFCMSLTLTTKNKFSSVNMSKGFMFAAGAVTGILLLLFALERIKQEFTDDYKSAKEDLREEILSSNE